MSEIAEAPEGPRSLQLTAVFDPPDNEGWIQARLVALPGVLTAARTMPEARAMLIDAFREYLLALDDAAGDAEGRERLVITIE